MSIINQCISQIDLIIQYTIQFNPALYNWTVALYSFIQPTINLPMIAYHYHNLILSAQLAPQQIVIEALPKHITHLNTTYNHSQPIQKAFTGQITLQTINLVVTPSHNPFTNITNFYQYLCKCFNEQQAVDLKQGVGEKKIKIGRQWCMEQRGKSQQLQGGIVKKRNRVERLIIRIVLPATDKMLKQQKGQVQVVQHIVQLKETYWQLNRLLLKVNWLVLNERDYLKVRLFESSEEMKDVYKKCRYKLKRQFKSMKKQLNSTINNFIKKYQQQAICSSNCNSKGISSINSNTKGSCSSNSNMKGSHIKVQQAEHNNHHQYEQTQEQPRKSISTPKKQPTIRSPQKRSSSISDKDKYEKRMKSQDVSLIKYEEDQESQRLRNTQQLTPIEVMLPIPLEFDRDNPAYHFFTASNQTVTKIGGFDYPKMMLKYIIPRQDTHGVIIRYVFQKKMGRICCLQVGIIDERIKNMLHSSVGDNYIKFKFNVSTVFTKVRSVQTKRKFSKLRVLRVGQWVELRVSLSLGIISWYFSYGLSARVQIPWQLRSMNLQPFVGMFTTNDMVQLQSTNKMVQLQAMDKTVHSEP